jgi:diguanylate cyclase (GGDEF)-like protein
MTAGSEQRAAYRVLASDVAGLARRLRRRVPAWLDADAIVSGLLEALRACDGDGRHSHSRAVERFDARASQRDQLGTEVLEAIRDDLRSQLLESADPEDAVAALHCVSAVFDQLLIHSADRRAVRLEQLAFVDELTGLGNRRGALSVLRGSVAMAHRHGRDLTAIAVDVDHLKAVNDAEGHDAGDRVLRSLAAAFRENLREADLAFRTGGDEFLVVCPETAPSEIGQLMERVAADAPPFSFGCAAADEVASAEQLWQLADERLIESRRARRSGAPRPQPVSSPVPQRWADVGRAAFVGVVVYVLASLHVPVLPASLALGLGAAAALGTSRPARASAVDFGPLVCGGSVIVAVALVVASTRVPTPADPFRVAPSALGRQVIAERDAPQPEAPAPVEQRPVEPTPAPAAAASPRSRATLAAVVRAPRVSRPALAAGPTTTTPPPATTASTQPPTTTATTQQPASTPTTQQPRSPAPTRVDPGYSGPARPASEEPRRSATTTTTTTTTTTSTTTTTQPAPKARPHADPDEEKPEARPRHGGGHGRSRRNGESRAEATERDRAVTSDR